MWDGIVLLGDPAYAQPATASDARDLHQGKLYCINGSTANLIENARIGVLMGTPTYSSTKLLGASGGTTNGGGYGLIYSTQFLNCHTGIYVTGYRPTVDNRTTIASCTFRGNAPLADAVYASSGVTPSTQYGVRLFNVGRVRLLSDLFELIDGTAAFGNQALPEHQRGYGLWSTGSDAAITVSTFNNLYGGVWVTNPTQASSTFIQGNTFVGNVSGVMLSGVLAPLVRDNIFRIGRGSYAFPYGLALYSSPSGITYDNTFESSTLCTTTICPSSRGLIASQLDGPVSSDANDPIYPIANEIYRNSFSNLNTGIYAQRGNSNLLLRCNSFRGANQTVTNTLPRADIEIAVGLYVTQTEQRDLLRNLRNGLFVVGHGQCDAADQSKAANNLFSYSGSTARSILVVNSPNQETLKYNYTLATNGITTPQLVTGANTSSLSGINPGDCGGSGSFIYATACPNRYGGGDGRSPSVLRATLDTITDPTERSIALNELLRYYLHDTTGIARLDSAIAVLTTYGTAAYADIDAGLRDRAGYPPSSLRMGAGTQLQTAVAQRTASASTSLYDEVRALLIPYGNDPAAVGAAVRTDAVLQAALVAIANDTTTWGYVAAQAVLSQHLGSSFGPWYENTDAEVLTRSAPLALQPERVKCATLFPNPATDAVTVRYALPASATASEFVVFNAFGKECARLTLRGKSGETTLSLAALAPGYYTYRVLVRGAPVQTGTIVKLP